MVRVGSLRIAFIHDNQNTPDGVATVIRNNMRGLQELLWSRAVDPHFHLIGATGHFDLGQFPGIDQSNIIYSGVDHLKVRNDEIADADVTPLAEEACSQILAAVANDDIVIFENPLIGHYAVSLEAFSLLINRFPVLYPAKDLVGRIHDLAEDRPDTVMPFLKARYRNDPAKMNELLYPGGVTLITMCDQFLRQIRAMNPAATISFLPNSISFPPNVSDANNAAVREMLGLGSLADGQPAKVITYPVRSMPRKCVEEAILLVEIMNRLFAGNGPFQLALPLTGSPVHTSYQRQVADFIGRVGARHAKYLPFEVQAEGEYSLFGQFMKPGIYDLINASAATITTGRQEGFGYAFVEPFTAGKGKPIFGRRLNVTRQEFESRGIDYRGFLYDRLDFQGRDLAEIEPLPEKLALIARILTEANSTQAFVRENGVYFSRLEKLFDPDTNYIAVNREIITREYSPRGVALRLLAETGLKNDLASIFGQ